VSPARSVLVVDWLGRGGIAHCSEAWISAVAAGGADVRLATRADRELDMAVPAVISSRTGATGAVGAHLALVSRLVRAVRRLHPDLVVLQNFVLPDIERAVVRAAHREGAQVVLVAHEPGAPRRLPGGSRALARLLREVDTLVVHSEFVGARIASLCGRGDIVRIPLPLPVGLLARVGCAPPLVPMGDGPLGLHFGHLHREYKGSDVFAAISADPLPPWRFALVGRGARALAGETTESSVVDRFVTPDELVATVAASDATVLPYRRASQSGAVVLAQAVGSVVLSTGVGGLAEQVVDGVNGLVLDVAAPVGDWRDRLGALADPRARVPLATEARRRVHEGHVEFTRFVSDLVSG